VPIYAPGAQGPAGPTGPTGAAGAAGGIVPIFDTILGAAAAAIDITSIPQGYASLLLVLEGRSDAATTNTAAYCQFNGDTGANYDYQQMQAGGTGVSASNALATATGFVLGNIIGNTGPAGVSTLFYVDIPNYSRTTWQKQAFCRNSLRRGTTAGDTFVTDWAGWWRNAAAITSMHLWLSTGNWMAGSRATLYGLLATVPSGSAPALTAPVPATTLSASPVDGQQAILVDNTSTPTYAWLMQWNALAAKWIFIGGTNLFNESSASGTLANQSTYAALPGGAASITLPRAGRYNITFGAGKWPQSNADTLLAVRSPSITPADVDAVNATQSGGGFINGSRTIYNRVGAASDVVTLWYKAATASGWGYANTYISAVPVWVT